MLNPLAKHAARSAIVTRFIGATRVHGPRIKATCAAGSATVPYDSDLSVGVENHRAAVQALLTKLKWTGHYAAGGMPNDDGYVFVEVPMLGELVDALGGLLQFAVGNRGNRDGNPYCKREVPLALNVLHDFMTGSHTSDATTHYDAADLWLTTSNVVGGK